MSEDRFHFQIPKENIHGEKFKKRGFGRSYIRADYNEHAAKLLTQYEEVVSENTKSKDSNIASQLFIQIEIPPGRELKSEKLKLQMLGINLINYSKFNKSKGTAFIEKKQLEELQDKLLQYKDSEEHTGKSYISIIEEIGPIPFEDKIEKNIDIQSEGLISAVFTIFSTLPIKEKDLIINKLTEELKGHSLNIKGKTFANGISSITCKIEPSLITTIAGEYSSINEIKCNSNSIIATSLPSLHTLPSKLEIAKPISESTICIIDSSVHQENQIFKELITKISVQLPEPCINPYFDHGTFVASRCIFGDNLDTCMNSLKLYPYCKIMSVQVFGKIANGDIMGHEIYDLMGIIEDTVIRNYKEIKVYNLSIGNDESIIDGKFSDFAKLLDFLSKKHKILFVISSGNIRQLRGEYPVKHFEDSLSRINSPAESLLSLTVGSIAKFSDTTSLALLDEISPFSRVGPGADGGMKPELVAHGGNLLNTYSHSYRLGAYGISGDGLGLSVDNGTSFSAPLISQYAQILFDLYPSSNPNLIKALLCHFAEQRKIPKKLLKEKKHYVGFGEPIINRATEAVLYNATFIYEGKIDQDNYQFVTFHIPESLDVRNKKTKLKIRITLTYDPPVNINNDLEYSQARISVILRKPTNSGMKNINVADQSKYFMPWNPIVHFEKEFTRAYLTGAWDLKLRLYTRGELPDDYLQDYAVTIEIIDVKFKQDIYKDVSNEYGSIYKKFKIRYAA